MLSTALLLIFFVQLINSEQGYENEDKVNYGPFYLPEWELPTLSNTEARYYIKVWYYPKEIKVHWIDIARWMCTSSGSRPFYTASQKYKVEHVVLTEEEAKKSVLEKTCLIGDYDETEVRGSDGEKLCAAGPNSYKRTVPIKEKNMKKTCPDLAYWSDRCYTSWSCVVKEFTLPVYLTLGSNGYTPCVYLSNGTKLPISERPPLVSLDEGFLVFTSIDTVPTSSLEQVPCYKGHLKPDILCVYKDSIVLRFEKIGSYTSFNNYYFYLEKEIPGRKKREAGDPASIGDIAQLNNRLQLLENSLNYQFLHEIQVVYDLRNKIEILARSLSKIDDELIGNLMGQNFRSLWHGTEIFYLIPKGPVDLTKFPGESCIGKYRYIEGRWTDETMGDHQCSNSSVSPHPLNLFKGQLTEPVEVAFSSDFRQASIGYEGWKYIANYKGSLSMVGDMFYSDGSAKGGWAGSVDNALEKVVATLGGLSLSSLIVICLVVFILKRL